MAVEHITVGMRLKAARKSSDRSLCDIATETCIRSGLLRAIEDQNFEELPARAFTIGFVRTYARELGLDAEEIVSDYKNAYDEAIPLEGEDFDLIPTPTPTKKLEFHLPFRSMFMSGALVAMLGAWWSTGTATQANLDTELGADSVVADVVSEPAERAERAPVQKAGLIDIDTLMVIPTLREKASERFAAFLATDELEPVLPEPASTQLIADRDAWVMVKQGEDLVFEGILGAGKSITLQPERAATVWTSDAGALRHDANSPMGSAGQTLEAHPLPAGDQS